MKVSSRLKLFLALADGFGGIAVGTEAHARSLGHGADLKHLADPEVLAERSSRILGVLQVDAVESGDAVGLQFVAHEVI